MARSVAIGLQDFQKIIKNKCFYVDKTSFIKEWWELGDDVTLIAHPRRFGKTLNLSMLNYFFSLEHKGRGIYLRVFPFGRMKNIGRYRGVIR